MYYLCAALTLISASISLFFSLLAVKRSKDDANEKALYVTARSIAFWCISIVPFFMISTEMVVITSLGMIIVQFLDGFIGIKIKDKFETWGPFIIAVAHLVALVFFIL
ncbi:hypothetical protein [Planococcus chinensis]|uniref:Uncharacterized protein n=1 Tax=Planococcus chinensis TaxID=272917 RepID=A0ABW4QHC4_9BACL